MRKAAAPPPPRQFSGAGSGSSSISAEDSDSMSGESLEGRIELSVYLPGGKVVRTSVERRTPMMDLLVQVTKANNLSPGGFILKLTSDNSGDPLPYKPSSAIGSLSCSTVYVVPKSSQRDSSLPRKDSKIVQPFEKTFRLRVHLPRNQLHVLRVSPNTPLVDVFRAICMDRELALSKYELRHPKHREERLDPQRCLTDYGLSEVAVVAIKELSSGLCRSSSDIMALQQDEDRKKRGFFGFMFKKNKSSIGDTSSDGHSSRGVSPARSDNSEIQSISPPPSTIGAPTVNRRPLKKRVAPPPPAVKPPAPKPPPSSPTSVMPVLENIDSNTTIMHSRNSSDSSGYHEASILSDSPECNNALDNSNGRRNQQHSSTKCKVASVKSPAPSNLTLVNSTSSLSVSTGLKKRKAPVPPTTPTSPVSAPSPTQSSPSPILNNSFTHSSQVSNLSTGDVNGNVANSTTSKFSNEEHPINDNGYSRSSSISSRASSSGEEVQTITTTVPPQPVPRLSKTPILMSNGNLDDDTEINKDLPEFNVDDINSLSSRRTSTSSTLSHSSKIDDFHQFKVENEPAVKMEIKEELNSSVEVDDAIGHRLSNVSSASDLSRDSVKNVIELNHDAYSDPVDNDEQTMTLSVDKNFTAQEIDNTDVSKHSEVSVQTNFDLDFVPPPLECYDDEEVDANDHFSGSSASSRSSSFSNEAVPPPVLNDDYHVKGGQDLSDFYCDLPEPINDNNPPSFNLNDFHNQFNISRQSVTGRWGRLVSLPNINLTDFSARNIHNSESDEEQDSSVEDADDSLMRIETNVILEEELADSSDNHGIAQNASIDNTNAWGPVTVEEKVLDTNARLDLETVIEKVFASIEESEEIPVEEHCETNINEIDELDNWEYSIPEVPPPPQFDNNYIEEIENNRVYLERELPEVVPEVPPEFQNLPEVENIEQSIISDIIVDRVDEINLNNQNCGFDETQEEVMNVAQPKEEKVVVRRAMYQRPVVKFSIATYKARDKEEVSYQSRLSKADSFSVSSNEDEAVKVTKYESSSLPRATTFREKPNIEQVSGQSKAIAEAIASAKPFESQPKEREIEIREKNVAVTNNVLMRRAVSEMHLDKDNDSVLANTSQIPPIPEQETLQSEYQKLHDQFMQWQQQLMQNQAVLQQQKISSESTTETLQRMQDLHQQFASLPPSIEVIEKVNSNKTDSLKRVETQVPSTTNQNGSNTNSLERRPAPRIGPKPWRPASVSITAWTPKRVNSDEPSLNTVSRDNLDKVNNNSNVSTNVTNSNGVTLRDKVAPITTSAKPVVFVNRNSTPASSNFPRWPVVKGFVLEPQPKSKVVLNSEKPTPQIINYNKPIQSNGTVEVKIASSNLLNGKSAVANIEIEDKSTKRGYINGSSNNSHINNNRNSSEPSKKFTTVVNLAQRQNQPQPSVPVAPPPPPPSSAPITLDISKTRNSFQRSVSSNSGEDVRDELMSAIKDFGGRSGLRKVSSSDVHWQQRYGNAY